MSKRFIITENEKRSILNQYGLLKEAYDQNTKTYTTEAGMVMYGDLYNSESATSSKKAYAITFPKGAKVASNNQGVNSVLTLNGTMSSPRKGAVVVTYTCGQSTFVYFDKYSSKSVSLYSDGLPSFVNKMKGLFCATNKNTPNQTTAIAKPADGPKDIKAFQQWVINTKKDKTILGKGGDSGFGDDGRWGKNTNTAWQKYGKEYNLSTQAAFQAPTNVDGSDENFDAPVQTAGTTPTTPTTPTATTTPTTPTTPTSQNPEIAADLKTASQIRQEFRQGKRDKNKAIRQYNQMVNKYNRLKSKMSSQDNTAYLQAMNQLKQQIG
jgi:hypothetical protein